MIGVLLVTITLCIVVLTVGVGILIGLQLKGRRGDRLDQEIDKTEQEMDEVVRYYTNLQKFIVDLDDGRRR